MPSLRHSCPVCLSLPVIFFLLLACFVSTVQAQEAKPPALPDEKTLAEIKELIVQLGADDPETRKKATERLAEIGEPAMKPLEEASKSADPEVVQRAAEITERIGIRGRLPKELPDKFPGIDRDLMGSRITFEPALRDLFVRMEARNATHSAIAVVIREAMRHRMELSLETREMVIGRVDEGNIKEAADSVAQLLGDQNTGVRGSAAGALGRLGAKEYAKDIAELLKDGDAYVRGWAANALGTLGAKEFAKDIAGLLKNGDAYVRGWAANALGDLGARDYARDITELLKDTDPQVRLSALAALGNLGARDCAKDIAKLLKDTDCQVRGSAAVALSYIGTRDYAKSITELLKDDTGDVRYSAAKALGNLDAKEYTKDIAELLKDNYEYARESAADALGRLGAKEYAKDIAELLKEGDKYTVASASVALVRLGQPPDIFMERLLENWRTGPNGICCSALNGARNPELYAALDTEKLPEYEFGGGFDEMLSDLAKRIGLKAEFVIPASENKPDWFTRHCIRREVSAWELLVSAMDEAYQRGYLIVLEGPADNGRIVLTPTEDALKIVEEWWKSRKK